MTEKELKAFKTKRNNFVKSKLRIASIRWGPKGECLKDARVDRGKYRCKMCSLDFNRQEMEIDHIFPIIPPQGAILQENGDLDWNAWIERCFVTKEGLQCLCKSCHKAKTSIEDSLRVHYGDIKREEKKQKIKKEKK